MRKSYVITVALLAAAATATLTSAQEMEEKVRAVAGGGVKAAGWQGKIDAGEAKKGAKLEDALLEQKGGVFHIAESFALPRFPEVTAALVYLHIVAFGSVLLSGFWGLASERFDPRDARSSFAQITAFGTLGSLAGGLLAEQIGRAHV